MSDLVYVRDARVVAHIEKLQARIEALEAALRYTAETAAGELNYTGQSRSTRAALQKINVMARAALAPEQDE